MSSFQMSHPEARKNDWFGTRGNGLANTHLLNDH